MGRTFASKVSHRRFKWVILVFWLVLAAASGPLAGALTDEQGNEVSSWLPGDAESTKAIELQADLGSDPDVIQAVVVYERTSGLTDEDLAAISDDMNRIPRIQRALFTLTRPGDTTRLAAEPLPDWYLPEDERRP